jgi:hypothetical protein
VLVFPLIGIDGQGLDSSSIHPSITYALTLYHF